MRARAASLVRQRISPKRLVLRACDLSSGGCFAAGRAALGNRCLGAAVVKIDANRNCCDSHLSPRTHACSIAAPAYLSVLSQTIDTLAFVLRKRARGRPANVRAARIAFRRPQRPPKGGRLEVGAAETAWRTKPISLVRNRTLNRTQKSQRQRPRGHIIAWKLRCAHADSRPVQCERIVRLCCATPWPARPALRIYALRRRASSLPSSVMLRST